LLLIMVGRMCMETAILNSLYAALFIILFIQLNRTTYLDNFLYEMGRRSTSMWLIHSYYCYYLFKDFIYGFKYPLMIFIVLLVISYLSAVVVDWINRPLQNLMKRC